MEIKNSFSLIKDWYFCCCMGCSPRTTNIFLSSLEFLDNPETKRKLKSISLEQIFLIEDNCMHIYALPQILLAFRRKFELEYSFNDVDKEIVFDFFSSLIDKTCKDDKVGRMLRLLLESCLDPKTGVTKLLDKIRFKDFIWTSMKNEIEKTPYRNIQNYLQESLLSVFICHLAHFNDQFKESLKSEKASDFEFFFSNALNGHYGRFVFGQIFSLPAELNLYEKGSKNLWNGKFSNIPEFEPDILTWYADLEFIKPFEDKKITSSSLSTNRYENILTEIQSLNRLICQININGLLPNEKDFKLREKDVINFLNQTGTNAKKPKTREKYILAIPFVFWQGLLIDMLVKADPVYAFENLSPLVTDYNENSSITIKGPDSALFSKIQKIYSNLLFFKADINSHINIKWKSKAKTLIIEGDRMIIASPLLSLNVHNIKEGNFKCINNWEYSPTLLILAGICVPIIRLLQQRDIHANGSKYLGLLVQTKALLLIYMEWLKNTQDHDYLTFTGNIRLSYPMTGLIKTTKGSLQMAGSGSLDSIRPSLFTEDLKFRNNNQIENYFDNYVYPKVLLTWILDAISGFDNLGIGQDRWRNLIGQVLEYYKWKQLDVATHWEKTMFGVILRMTVPKLYIEQSFINDINWKTFLGKHPENLNKISPRNFLTITNDLTLDDWLFDVVWENLSENVNADMIRLIRSIEALTLIMKNRQFKGLDESVKKLFDEYEYVTQKIADKIIFDRFIRIRLLQFLETLERYEEEQINELSWQRLQVLTVHLLLEFGTQNELVELLNKIFPFGPNGKLVENALLQRLQNSTVIALCRITIPVLYVVEANKNLELPFDNWLETKKTSLFKDIICKIGFAFWLSKNEINLLNDFNLSTRYIDLLKEYSRESISEFEEITKEDMISDEKWMKINTITYNPNRKRIRIFSNNFEVDDEGNQRSLFNFFTNDKWPDGIQQVKALAYVTTKGVNDVLLNCGLSDLLTFNKFLPNQIEGLVEGEPVIVTISKVNSNWSINGLSRFNVQAGSRIKEIEIIGKTLFEKLKTNLKGNLNDPQNIDVLSEWFADLSYMEDKGFSTEKTRVLVKFINNKKIFVPVYFYLESLLTANISNTIIQGSNNMVGITLSFIRSKKSSSMNTGCYIFSSSPGNQYQLYPKDFTLEALESLKPMIEDDYNRGLLVTLIPCLDEHGLPKLSLSSIDSQVSNEKYPQLKSPYDFRNVELFNLFSNDKDGNYLFSARKIQSDWIIYSKSNNIQSDIKLIPRKNPNPELTEVQFTFNAWDPFNRIVIGEIDKKEHLDAINNSYNYIFNIINGNIVTLDKVNKVNNCEIFVQVREGFEVRMPIYSLTMQAINQDQILEYPIKGRKALIKYSNPDLLGRLKINFLVTPTSKFIDAIVIGKFNRDLSRFEIWWENGNKKETALVEIIIDNNDYAIQLGDIITTDKNGNLQLFRWKIHANLIWHFNDKLINSPLIYLGEVTIQDNNVFLAEPKNNPGNLVLLKSDPEVGHLSTSNNQGIFTSGSDDHRKWNLPSSFKFNDKNKNNRYMIFLNNPKYGRISGIIYKDQSNQSSTLLDNVQIELEKLDDGFLLTRVFELRPQLGIESKTLISKKLTMGMQISRFRNALKIVMNGEYDKRANRMIPYECTKIPITTNSFDWNNENNWTDRIEIIETENVYISSRINVYDFQNCNFHIVPNVNKEEGYKASFRKVKPQKLLDLINDREITHKSSDNKYTITNRIRLFYDGYYESINCGIDFPNENGPYFNFEYGFGKTICVSATDVFINNLANIQKALCLCTNVLFHGDEIFNVDIIKKAKKWVLVINRYDIEQSEANQLVKQSERRIIHLVHYNPTLDIITKIIGFGNSGIQVEKQFHQSGAKLSDESKNSLKDKFDKWNEAADIPLYAKINTKKFYESNGKKLEYNCLHFYFDNGQKIINDFNDSLIFVKADKIEQGHNDYSLKITPITDVLMQIPEILKGMEIRRRDFSCDEETLARYFLTKQELLNQIFLVKLKIWDTDNGQNIHAKIYEEDGLDWMMLRHEKHLESFTRGRKQTYATFLGEKNNNIILELKPGIFFSVNKENWDLPPMLSRGDLLKLKIRKEQKVMKLASFGDEHYITGKPRSIVLLPMNDYGSNRLIHTFQKKDGCAQFIEKENLTVGSFPNLILSFWKGVTHDNIFEMMKKRNRFAELNKTEAGLNLQKFRIHNEGKIIWDSLTPMKSSMDNVEQKIRLDALSISFMDKLLSEICKRTIEIEWSYHDNSYPLWRITDGLIKPFWPKFSALSSLSGPIFFHEFENKFTLRYPDNEKRNFGFPVREILHYLNLKSDKQEVFYFAGLTYNQTITSGIWVEMTPGRLAEIPIDLLLIKSDDIDSSGFDWSLLSFGDELYLKLGQVDGQERQHLILEKWVPGSRGLLGSGCIYAPVQKIHFSEEHNKAQNGISIGNGIFELNLPYNIEIEKGTLVKLNLKTNRIEVLDNSSQLPIGQNSIVFLIHENENFKIDGWEEYQVEIDFSGWESILNKENQDFAIGELKEIVDEFGLLPVTIEEIIIDSKLIRISRRLQQRKNQIPIQINYFSIGQVVGQLNNRKIFVRFGNQLATFRPQDIIEGISNVEYGIQEAIVRLLIDQKGIVELCCRNENNCIKIGLYQTSDLKREEDARVFLKPNKGSGVIFIRPVSMELFYVSPEQAVLCNPTDDLISKAFNRGDLFPINYSEEKVYSIVKSRIISEWFDELKINSKFEATVLSGFSPIEGRTFSIVRHKNGAIAMCNYFTKENLIKTIPITVIVTDKEDRNNLQHIVLRGGKLPFELDYPFDAIKDDNFLLLENSDGYFDASAEKSFDEITILKLYSNLIWSNNDFNLEIMQKIFSYLEKIKEENKTISALPCLCAISILFKCIEIYWLDLELEDKQRSIVLLQYLRLRFLRNLHVEILSKEANPDWGEVKGGMKERFNIVAKRFNLKPQKNTVWQNNTFDDEEISKIRTFRKAVYIKNERVMRPSADALIACLGELESNTLFMDEFLLLNKFIKICNLLPLGSYLKTIESRELWLKISHTADEIIEALKYQERYIPLLPFENKI